MLNKKILRLVFGLICLGVPLGTAAAGNPFIIEKDPTEFTSSFAVRYWYGFGSTKKIFTHPRATNLFHGLAIQACTRIRLRFIRASTTPARDCFGKAMQAADC